MHGIMEPRSWTICPNCRTHYLTDKPHECPRYEPDPLERRIVAREEVRAALLTGFVAFMVLGACVAVVLHMLGLFP